jgi:hypothetical protein
MLGDSGFKQVTVWLLETNADARGFYEKMASKPDGGAKTSMIGTQQVLELRYRVNVL